MAVTELLSNDRWDLPTLEAWTPSWIEAWMYSSYTTISPGWGTQETNPIFASRSSDDSGQRLKIDVLLLAPRASITPFSLPLVQHTNIIFPFCYMRYRPNTPYFMHTLKVSS